MLKKVAFVLLAATACTSSSDERETIAPTPSPAPAPSVTATPAAPVATPTPATDSAPVSSAAPTVAPPRTATATNWRDRVKADLSTMNAQQRTELEQLAPQKTRAQFPRFTSDLVHNPLAASVFLDRLARGGESEEIRAALVEALPRTGGVYADASVDLMASEGSARVRAAYVFAARRAPAAQAVALMTRGLADGDANVQAEAARSAAFHPEGKRLATQLRTALASTSPAVRAESARTLGILKISDAQTDLAARLSDDAADVRLEALRAIDRIDPSATASLPLAKLATDSDPRIVALATRLNAAKPTIK